MYGKGLWISYKRKIEISSVSRNRLSRDYIVPISNDKIKKKSWKENEPWQRVCDKFLGEINNSVQLQ